MNVRLKSEQKIKVNHTKDIYRILQQILLREQKIDRNREHFWVVGLANNNKILYIELISLGTITGTIVEPMEVFSLALQKRTVRVILAHNHPSGELFPSYADQDVTDHLIQVGVFLKVPVMDHLIISETDYYSFAESGLLRKLKNNTQHSLKYLEEKRIKKLIEENAVLINNREIARDLKSRGMDIKSISSITKLTESAIERLGPPKEVKEEITKKEVTKRIAIKRIATKRSTKKATTKKK